ncbi:hypothetical protein BuS5_01775 [Desulfosarcina sp. BuS5]|uniref:DUF1573 domain-containing protein n=1 Tax=Desulfosarcina sp. BuS5 TaxID=933262 RepID=UPI000684D136|nr:DUF1573 domain-containing protein [Desulfosarcina sp. BuS5]WDN88807.1 hypothetical protein BuS5_01775 [Desulfosarcina sp. BuS5]
MKIRISIWILSFFYIIFLADVSLAVENKSEKFASIFLPSVIGRFAPVVEGVTVTHDFVIQNNGGAPLQIKKIRTSCGCTTASYSKSIPPGGAGKVTVKFNTRGYGGRSAHKYITLYTNDNNRPEINLTISGKVERFAVIEPPRVMLAGFAGESVKAEVFIIPEKKYPFTIVETGAKNGKNFSFKLKEIKKSGRSGYKLLIKNLKKEKGRYHDYIYLETDSKIKPQIKISVYGNIKAKMRQKIHAQSN